MEGRDRNKFEKSKTNRVTENAGLALLRLDPRFQVLDVACKRRLLELLRVEGAFGAQTFDAVMTSRPTAPIDIAVLPSVVDDVTLVEMKTTRKAIRNSALNGYFFGATEREYELARALGERFKFAFVVLNDRNDYGHPFFVLLTLDEVEARTRASRIQFQVNFRTDTVHDPRQEYFPNRS